VKIVTSAENPAVLEVRRLERDRKERDRKGVYLAWGLHLAGEALSAGAAIERAFVDSSGRSKAEMESLIARLETRGTSIVQVTARVLDAMAEGAGDQGVLLVLRRPDGSLDTAIASGATLVLVAHGVQDPGNLGSMARSALACGAGALVAAEGCADPFSSKVVRAAMGAHGRMPLIGERSDRALATLREAGFLVAAAEPGGGKRPDAVDLTRKVALLLGSEGGGLPPAILRGATERIRIPMSPSSSSFNVAAAAAILLYEIQRQRGFPVGPS